MSCRSTSQVTSGYQQIIVRVEVFGTDLLLGPTWMLLNNPTGQQVLTKSASTRCNVEKLILLSPVSSRLTVGPCVGAADGWQGGAARHYELVEVTLVVGRLRLGQDHVVYI